MNFIHAIPKYAKKHFIVMMCIFVQNFSISVSIFMQMHRKSKHSFLQQQVKIFPRVKFFVFYCFYARKAGVLLQVPLQVKYQNYVKLQLICITEDSFLFVNSLKEKKKKTERVAGTYNMLNYIYTIKYKLSRYFMKPKIFLIFLENL